MNANAIAQPPIPTKPRDRYDVLVVGASLAGCTAAVLYARAGLSVALVERSREPEAFKRFCTHYIQASAVPTLRRLGITAEIEAAGALPNRIDMWCPWGRVGESPAFDDKGRSLTGYNLRRQKLDPILRRLAERTEGVDCLLGTSARGLIVEQGRIRGIETGGEHEGAIRAQLVVAADGRQSALAQLAQVRTKSAPNKRFMCAAYYKGLALERPTTSLMWLDHENAAYLFPNDEQVSVVACMLPKERLDAFRADPSAALESFYGALPDAVPLDPACRLGSPMLVKDYPNQWRDPVHRGMALIGDAATSIDPLWGIGCGWALQSAEWLVDATAATLRGREELAPALRAYGRRHARELGGHRFLINDFARRLKLNPIERLMFTAAVRDEAMGRHLAAFGTRWIRPSEFLSPLALIRAVRVLLRTRPARAEAAPAP